ncbi:MAG: carbamoyl transferase [Candidatus Yanofskybacteria bacterium]|nr:carbamoyl transferase [Candidatus Yanofskybacteria bacterium]
MPSKTKKPVRILGIGPEVWISSAALIENGRIVAGAAEERFNRQKASRDFPFKSIEHCLKEAKCKFEDIDYVAVGWNPAVHLKLYNYRFSKASRWRAEYLYSIPNHLMTLMKDKKVDYVEQNFAQKNGKCRIAYVNHHTAHAANAFFLSPYKKAAILTVDGRGEDDTALFAIGNGNKIEELRTVEHPHSLGLVYTTFTQFLGFQIHTDEWKVMALASYGSKNNSYYTSLKKMFKLKPDGRFEIDLTYFDYYLHDRNNFWSHKLTRIFGEPRTPDSKITKRHQDIAAALQQVTEEVLAHMLNCLYKETGITNLTVGGGTFMNSVFNGKITKMTPFKNVFISSCPDDSGISIGAATYVYNHILGNPHRYEQSHNFYGPELTASQINKDLLKYGQKATYIKNIENYAARLISEGKIIGWFQGKMEFGQRALGNRSILADARDPNMKDRVNSVIKYRESFRPFAPSILEEEVHDYFDCAKNSKVPFMERVYLIKEDKQKSIPAVTHIDGTGRLQTVSRATNPRYYKLIEEFKKLTGIPVVMNTSFNLKGEPIVCTSTDAIRTFHSCGLDALIIGNYALLK